MFENYWMIDVMQRYWRGGSAVFGDGGRFHTLCEHEVAKLV